MTPLIDGDILLHELGWSSQFKDKDTGEEILFDFEVVEELLNKKIDIICEDVGATKPPILFLSDSPWYTAKDNNRRKWLGLESREYVEPFRYGLATSRPYKGTRNNPKPFHFYNIATYLLANYEVRVDINGMEADDLICKTQWEALEKGEKTIICSRDKDLRICPGWHYSWECGKQLAVGPYETDSLGKLEFINDKFIGFGRAFFYYQMLVGDTADNIPGLPKYGHAKALKLLSECETEVDYYNVVKHEYKNHPTIDNPKEYFFEQANLLWMQMCGPYKPPKG
tara:strand:+ start:10150 stop:10998 length:849 start_codon:yes stop_codon:yes gene_type:complete